MSGTEAGFAPLQHARFTRVEIAIFTNRLVADCMQHDCVEIAGGKNLAQHDICCQYGADVDLFERDRILQHADAIARVMHPAAAAAPWFTEEQEEMEDFPSGAAVRTATFAGGCVFLQHDKRGCAIHRVALEQGWDFRGTKPHVCRMFPMTYDDDTIMVSDDYPDYSCAFVATAPTLYRVQRETIGDVFGPELVAELDRVEAEVLSAVPRRLPVVK